MSPTWGHEQVHEALMDAWEEWKNLPTSVLARVKEHFFKSDLTIHGNDLGVYVYVSRVSHRYFRWRDTLRRRHSLDRKKPFLEELSRDISDTAFSCFLKCLEDDHQQHVVFSLWSEGMSPPDLALFLNLPIQKLNESIDQVRDRIKSGVQRGHL